MRSGPDGERRRCTRLQHGVNNSTDLRASELTVHLLEARLARNRGGGMAMKRAEVPGNLELLVDVDLLVTEDWKDR
jgi:hypothetical protein